VNCAQRMKGRRGVFGICAIRNTGLSRSHRSLSSSPQAALIHAKPGSFRFRQRSTSPRRPSNSDRRLSTTPISLQTFTMSFHRVGLRLAQQMRSPALRSTIQRRFETSSSKLPLPGAKLTGTADNAFNRERAAVKAHAAATSGMRCLRECN